MHKDELAVVGFVDAASSTTVIGWIRTEYRPCKFFVELDGLIQWIELNFTARTDLMNTFIDGLGFEAHYRTQLPRFSLRFGFESEDHARTYLNSSETGLEAQEIFNDSQDIAVLDAEELRSIASAIDADSGLYLNFTQNYGHIIEGDDWRPDVLFVDGTHGSVSVRYRIFSIADGLRELGYTTMYVDLEHVGVDKILNMKARVAVFFRAPLDENYAEIVQQYKSQGTRIVYDIDDLVFDEEIVTDVDGVRYLNHDEMSAYLDGVRQYRKFALASDLVTTSTQFLGTYAEKSLNKKAYPIRNTLGKRYLKFYAFQPYRKSSKPQFTIGYYSGSKTHQRDFAVAYKAIVRFLNTYLDSKLRIVGMLDLNEFPDLQQLKERVELLPFIDYHKMIKDHENCDVIISPLVSGEPFCEAKSELKFFEAALRYVPCIASGTHTFITGSDNGRYCLIANSEEEWFNALINMYMSPTLRDELAESAHEYVVQQYSYKVAGLEAEKIYFGVKSGSRPIQSPKPRKPVKSPYSIGVLMPGLVIGGGGHRKILNFCRGWAKEGHVITLYIDSMDDPVSLRRTIKSHFFDFPYLIKNYRGVVGKHDILVCTHWTTAYSLRNYPAPERVFYFVQDFEPMFEPVSTNYVKAIATYNLGFNIACYGRWVADRLEHEVSVSSDLIKFTMDKSLYVSKKDAVKSVDILFFARPSQPRRCFELGIEALKILYRRNTSLRIALFGEDEYGDLGFPYHNYGLITKVDTISSTYNQAKVGICFSSTNPSLVGYEMISSGLPLVDIKIRGSELNFDGDGFVYYALPIPDSIANCIAAALNDREDRDRRIVAGLEFVSSMPDDGYISSRFMEIINQRLGKKKR